MLFKFSDADVIRNTIKCYPQVEFLIYSGGNVILNKRISEGQNINSGTYNRKEPNVDRSFSQRINPYIYKNQYYDAIDGFSLSSASYGSVITGTYIDNKGYVRYQITSTSQPEYTTINRIFQGYRKYISGPFETTDISVNDGLYELSLQVPFCALMFNREIYGSRIKENSVDLNLYLSGQIASSSYFDKNGILYFGSYNDGIISGTVKVGYVLYHYGIILLDSQQSYSGTYFHKYFGMTFQSESNSFKIKFNGVHDIQNLTMFCNLDKKLNLSNNPTYILKGQNLFQTQSSIDSFKENDKLLIKNLSTKDYIKRNIDFINDNYNSLISTGSYNNMIINTSSFGDDTFEKGVYISSINIYDKDKNLIAVVNFANPIRKTEALQYIIKLQIDM